MNNVLSVRETATQASERDDRINQFLSTIGWGEAERTAVKGGASTRCYTRLRDANGMFAILMDIGFMPTPTNSIKNDSAHNQQQTILPTLNNFCSTTKILRDWGLSAPEIIAQTAERDLALVEDFGEREYIRLLEKGFSATSLLSMAVDVLATLHNRIHDQPLFTNDVRTYSVETFISQLSIIPEIYCPFICGKAPNASEKEEFKALWKPLIEQAFNTPQSFILRDFAISNLFYLDERSSPMNVGVIDYELAGKGPMLYDFASVLHDNRFAIPTEAQESARMTLLAKFPTLTHEQLLLGETVFCAIRQIEWAGICARYTQQGREGFLAYLPSIWAVVESQLTHPSLKQVKDWIDRHIPISARRTPLQKV